MIIFHELLPSLVLYPLVAGLACLILPDSLKNITKALAFFVTLACLAGASLLFMTKPASWQFASRQIFVVDNLSGFAGLAVSSFAFLIALYSSSFIKKDTGRYFGYLLITLAGALGAVFANDLIVLMISWGFLAVTLYLLVNTRGGDGASAAAKKALIIVGGTDAMMIFGIALIWGLTGTFTMNKIHLDLKNTVSIIAYLSIVIACLAKSGAFPFHSWLPDVAEFAPAPVAAYLPASLDKLLGIYLLARMSLNLFITNNISNTILALVGAVTIIFAVFFALIQHDLKRLLGYHAVSQVGYMVLGIGMANPIGIAGALFHMLNNAVYKSCLFLCGGNVENRTGTTDLDKLGGLSRYMPVTFGAFLVASLSISGVPPFNGFVSKWMIYQAIIESAGPKNPSWILWLVAAMFGSALTAASFMKLLHAVFLGRSARDFSNVKEVGFFMSLPVVILSAACFLLGVFAFILPIPILIMPAVGLSITYLGTWSPFIATALIIIGIAAGFLIYLLSAPGRSLRTVPTFIGGEEPDSLERISGTDFYNTIKDVAPLGAIYKEQASGRLDLYNVIRDFVYYFTKKLQGLHNGVLPTYLVWCLLGMVGMFLIVFFR